MAVEMDDFLKKYYRRLHTSAMPGEVLDRLMDNKKKGILTGHQQEWFEEFLELDPNDPEGKKYKAKDVPELRDTAELDPDELVKLYKRFAKAISGMKAASKFYDNVDDAESLAFINKWFDELKLFSIPKATDKCKTSINNVIDLLKDSPEAANLKQKIVDLAKKDNGDKLFNNIAALDKLIDKCKAGKYDSDTDVQDKIKKVALALQEYHSTHYFIDNSNSSIDRIVQEINKVSDDLENIVHEDAFSEIEVTPKNLEDFREIYGNEILETLYRDKNVRKKFGEKDPKFIEIIEKAEGKIKWHDNSKDNPDYVKPKVEDVLTPLQQLEKWAKDKYSDTLKKYEELRGGHVFFSPHAKEICKAIDKEKVKPTDGLKGLLDKADAIKKRFNSRTLDEHFDWFVNTMNEVKDDIPKAIEGAWKDANQMKCVITQIILKATDPRNDDPDAMAKAKTAMEIMTVMKYGMLTSNVMDAFRTQEFSMFADGKLSWNKNEGIQFVTKAFDRGLKAAFTGIGYGITFVHNKIHLAGGKFKNKNNDRNKAKDPLSARFAEEQERIKNSRVADTNLLNREILDAEHEIDENQRILNDLKSKGFDSEANIKSKRDKLKEHDDKLKEFDDAKGKHNKIKEDNKDKHDTYEANQKQIDAVNNQITELENQRTEITNRIQEIRNTLQTKNYIDPLTNQPVPPAEVPAFEAHLYEEIQNLSAQGRDLTSQIQAQQDSKNSKEYKKLVDDNAKLKPAYDAYQSADAEIANIDKQIEQYKTANNYEDLQSNVNKFTEASESLEEQQKTLDARREALQNWDKDHVNRIAELENFWNFLQSGKTTTWRFSLEKQQKKFDANKMALYNQFVNDHGMET